MDPVEPDRRFHRSYSLLHSRTVEYPYAKAAMMGLFGMTALDVGISGADPLWLDFFEDAFCDSAYAIDLQIPEQSMSGIKFARGDIRQSGYEAETFDIVFAISVIEHVGLPADEDGDRRAIFEITRILKPGGHLVMTVPFGRTSGHCSLNNYTRRYNLADLHRLTRGLKTVDRQYYEYQHLGRREKYNPRRLSLRRFWRKKTGEYGMTLPVPDWSAGEVTWRNIPIRAARATNRREIDGVICGTWRKT